MSELNVTPSISVVIPVYKGEQSLPKLIAELVTLKNDFGTTPQGRSYSIAEILLVHDCGPDRSDLVIEKLCNQHPFIKPIWLSRNYGQHAATLSGMSSSSGDWVITMDEDGQQNPRDIPSMLDAAINGGHQIVYAHPINQPPHGKLRNFCSKFAKELALKLLNARYQPGIFNSFRLINGELSRIIAAYCGHGVYLDVALIWVAQNIGHHAVKLRNETRPSSYSIGMLFNHFWKMILTSGTRPLRIITIMGGLSFILALFLLGYSLYSKFISQTIVQGWASLLIIISFFSGLIMISLGVVAEYLALATGIIMGKPLYVVTSKATKPIRKK